MGGGIFATTFWLLWQNGGGAIVVAVPGVPGIEYAAPAIRLHYRATEE